MARFNGVDPAQLSNTYAFKTCTYIFCNLRCTCLPAPHDGGECHHDGQKYGDVYGANAVCNVGGVYCEPYDNTVVCGRSHIYIQPCYGKYDASV